MARASTVFTLANRPATPIPKKSRKKVIAAALNMADAVQPAMQLGAVPENKCSPAPSAPTATAVLDNPVSRRCKPQSRIERTCRQFKIHTVCLFIAAGILLLILILLFCA